MLDELLTKLINPKSVAWYEGTITKAGGAALSSRPTVNKRKSFVTGAQITVIGSIVATVLMHKLPEQLQPYAYVAMFVGPCAFIGWRTSEAYGLNASSCILAGIVVGGVLVGLVSCFLL